MLSGSYALLVGDLARSFDIGLNLRRVECLYGFVSVCNQGCFIFLF